MAVPARPDLGVADIQRPLQPGDRGAGLPTTPPAGSTAGAVSR